MAIICACLVTYRPLFANVNVNLSKFSSLFSRSGSTPSDNSNTEEDSEMQWPAAQHSGGRDTLRLNDKSRQGRVHVVNIGLSDRDPKYYSKI